MYDQSDDKKPKRTKLAYKNRWLCARDLVMHLRHAGIECDIIIPEYAGETLH